MGHLIPIFDLVKGTLPRVLEVELDSLLGFGM